MNIGGWIIMFASVAGVTLLFVWCIVKVLNAPKAGNMHGFEFETPDEKAQHADSQGRGKP